MSINKENIEEHIFDYLEGNLSERQITEFREYINSDNEAKAEFQYWKQTYLPDSSLIESTEFTHLKKSNKWAKWSGGVAAAFLIGAGTMYLIMQENPTVQVEMPPKKEQIEISNDIESTKTPVIDAQVISPSEEIENINSTQNMNETRIEPSVQISEEEGLGEELDFAEQRNIQLKSANGEREPITEKVKITKQEAEKNSKTSKKNTEVDVIELNSEGF